MKLVSVIIIGLVGGLSNLGCGGASAITAEESYQETVQDLSVLQKNIDEMKLPSCDGLKNLFRGHQGIWIIPHPRDYQLAIVAEDRAHALCLDSVAWIWDEIKTLSENIQVNIHHPEGINSLTYISTEDANDDPIPILPREEVKRDSASGDSTSNANLPLTTFLYDDPIPIRESPAANVEKRK